VVGKLKPLTSVVLVGNVGGNMILGTIGRLEHQCDIILCRLYYIYRFA